MLTTLENARLKVGDVVRVRAGQKVYTATVQDTSDRAKVLVELHQGGRSVWVGRRAVVSVE